MRRKILAVLLVISIVLNAFMAVIVFTKLPSRKNDEVSYASVRISLKHAGMYLEQSLQEADSSKKTNNLFLAFDMIYQSQLNLKDIEPTLYAKRIPIGKLESDLNDLQFNLRLEVGKGMMSRGFDADKVKEIQEGLIRILGTLPENYDLDALESKLSEF